MPGDHRRTVGSSGGHWTVLAPPGTTKITLPDLPDDLASIELPDGQSATIYFWLVEAADIEGYAGFRAVMSADLQAYVDHADSIIRGRPRFAPPLTRVSGSPIEN